MNHKFLVILHVAKNYKNLHSSFNSFEKLQFLETLLLLHKEICPVKIVTMTRLVSQAKFPKDNRFATARKPRPRLCGYSIDTRSRKNIACEGHGHSEGSGYMLSIE